MFFWRYSEKDLNTKLLTAIVAKNSTDVREAIKAGANVNLKITNKVYYENFSLLFGTDIAQTWFKDDSESLPAFHFAAMLPGNAEVVKTMLASGADIKVEYEPSFEGDKTGSILHNALKMHCDRKIVDVLIKAGLDINAKNRHGNSAFLSIVNPYHSIGYNSDKEYSERVKMMEIFLDNGAQLSCEDIDETFSMFNRITTNPAYEALLTCFIEHGLMLEQNKTISTLHELARIDAQVIHKSPDAEYLVMNKGKERTEYEKNFRLPRVADAQELITAHRFELDPIDVDGRTPLSIAAANCKSTAVLKLLLQQKNSNGEIMVNLDSKDNKGLTPLMHAVISENKKGFAELVKAGANLTESANDGKTLAGFIIDCRKDNAEYFKNYLMMSLAIKEHREDLASSGIASGFFRSSWHRRFDI